MPQLSSGLVIAGAYADKIRRTLFAQMRDYVRRDKAWGQRVAYAAAQLNRLLYTILVEQLKIDKGDVVRVRIEYEIDEENMEIKWKWETLQIEAFRRIPQEEVEKVVKSVVKKGTEEAPEEARIENLVELQELGKAFDGDVVYAVKLGDETVGAIKVKTIDESTKVATAVITVPEPRIIVNRRIMEPRDALKDIEVVGKPIEPERAKDVLERMLKSVEPEPATA